MDDTVWGEDDFNQVPATPVGTTVYEHVTDFGAVPGVGVVTTDQTGWAGKPVSHEQKVSTTRSIFSHDKIHSLTRQNTPQGGR